MTDINRKIWCEQHWRVWRACVDAMECILRADQLKRLTPGETADYQAWLTRWKFRACFRELRGLFATAKPCHHLPAIRRAARERIASDANDRFC